MSFNMHFMSSKRTMIMASLILMVAACSTPSAQEPSAASPGPGKSQSGQRDAVSLRSAANPVEPTSELAREPYRLEKLLGATCSNAWMDEVLFRDGGCYGYLPTHIKWFLENIPDDKNHIIQKMKQNANNKKWPFFASPGFGTRADFSVRLSTYGDMWLRSFEEKNGKATWYLVYGPLCFSRSCKLDDVSFRNNFHLYKITDRKRIEDMSHLFPLPPPMSQAERKRYGPLTTSDQPSHDILVQFDASQLASHHIMRWIIPRSEAGEYEAPCLSKSDPRYYRCEAHFGFTWWDGKAFHYAMRVPDTLWQPQDDEVGMPDIEEDSFLIRSE